MIEIDKTRALIIGLCFAVITSIFMFVVLVSVYDNYHGDKFGNINWSTIDYNGTHNGGYSVFKDREQTDVYFSPTGDDCAGCNDCLGCSNEVYHIVCFDVNYRYCYLAEKLIRVGGVFYG